MTGQHGTIREYMRAYRHYGGKPPIPKDSTARRGARRSRPAYVLGMVLTAATFVGMFAFSYWIAGPGEIPSSVMMFIGGLAAVIVDMFVMTPVQDWYEDVPRYGLESIDAEYGVPSLGPEGLDQ